MATFSTAISTVDVLVRSLLVMQMAWGVFDMYKKALALHMLHPTVISQLS